MFVCVCVLSTCVLASVYAVHQKLVCTINTRLFVRISAVLCCVGRGSPCHSVKVH